MSGNHKGRNLGTDWLSYMHYFPWILIQPRATFRCGWPCPFCTTSGPQFHLFTSDHRIFSETALPEESLEMLCLGHFFILQMFPLISCGEQRAKWQRFTGLGLPECAIVWPSNKNVFLAVSFHNSHSLVSLQKAAKKAAVWEWRERRREEGEDYLDGGWVSLWAGRVLGRGQRAAGGHRTQGAEGEDGGVVGVPGRRAAAGQILQRERDEGSEEVFGNNMA